MTDYSWKARSGAVVNFKAYTFNTQWNDVSGLYIYFKVENGTRRPVYIGQAGSFRDRLSNHERHDDAVRAGAAGILAAIVGSQTDRDSFEKELIQQFQPELNDHYTN